MKKIQCHNLKIESYYFDAVKNGSKTFEIRLDDRDYRAGDFVVLHEYRKGEVIRENTIEKRIGFVTGYEQKEGYVVFSLIDL